ncbi:hypothetical protein ACF1BN_29815 [Streptomyces sp. NPDC014861]|uniref:hypothetical protein n=1 Tax=Streptomyces sp. NPDC014861 TaxID=3364923 RepID=UPI0036F676B5
MNRNLNRNRERGQGARRERALRPRPGPVDEAPRHDHRDDLAHARRRLRPWLRADARELTEGTA